MRVAHLRWVLGAVAVGTMAVAGVACSGGGGGGGGSGGGSNTVTVDGTHFGGDAGDLAYLRIINGGNVAFCSSASVGGGNPSFEFVTPATLSTNVNYTGELFIDVDANNVYSKPGDPSYKVTIGKVSATTGNTIVVDGSNGTSNISWKANKGCPGK